MFEIMTKKKKKNYYNYLKISSLPISANNT